MKIVLVGLLALAFAACGTDKPFSRGEKTTPSSNDGSNANNNGMTPVNPDVKEFFITQIHPKMMQTCMKCHDGGIPEFTVSADPAATYEMAKKLIVAGNPEQSTIYNRARGVAHGGGKRWADGSPEIKNLGYWILNETP